MQDTKSEPMADRPRLFTYLMRAIAAAATLAICGFLFLWYSDRSTRRSDLSDSLYARRIRGLQEYRRWLQALIPQSERDDALKSEREVSISVRVWVDPLLSQKLRLLAVRKTAAGWQGQSYLIDKKNQAITLAPIQPPTGWEEIEGLLLDRRGFLSMTDSCLLEDDGVRIADGTLYTVDLCLDNQRRTLTYHSPDLHESSEARRFHETLLQLGNKLGVEISGPVGGTVGSTPSR